MKNIELPQEFDLAKVIQLIINGEPLLIGKRHVKGATEEIYHPDILAEFLISRGIKYKMDSLRPPSPALKGKRYHAVGMGKCKIEDCYVFGGYSSAYDRLGINEDHLRQLQALNPEFRFRIDPSFD